MNREANKCRHQRAGTRKLFFIMIPIILFACGSPSGPSTLPDADSPTTAWTKPRSNVRLLLDKANGPPFTAALLFEAPPRWHLYWKNPGESGMGPNIRWILPEGWSIGAESYETPKLFEAGGVIGYGYEDRSVILVPITPGAGLGPIAVEATWLICDEACVLFKERVEIDPALLSPLDATKAREVIEAARRRMPRPASEGGIIVAEAAIEARGRDGFEAIIRLNGENAARATAFYPEPRHDILFTLRGIKVENSTIRLPFRGNATEDPTTLNGILVAPEGAWHVSTAVRLPERR